ncbi:MAG TPA: RIP metalloprotease RseP [Pseudogracilibacillus sp.]|nr:RIP metalloprotease RseP [Pseudogracilibacillus sp.]
MKTVIAFIFMFGLLVFVHEWGHLIFAKRAGMLAREFAIGFGPKIFSFVRNETLYTIRLLPIGGYVRVAGDDPEIIELKPGHHIGLQLNDEGKVKNIIVNNKEKYPNIDMIEVDKVDLTHDLFIEGYDPIDMETKKRYEVDRKSFFIMDGMKTQIAPYDRQFASKTVGQRAMQLFAGPMMNFILAIVMFMIIGFAQGVPTDKAKIGEVMPDSPAAEAGLMTGDEVVEIANKPVSDWISFTDVIRENAKKEIELHVLRDGKEELLHIIPLETVIQDESGEHIKIGQVGVLPAYEKSFFKTLVHGFNLTYETTKLIIVNLVMLITGQVSIELLSGPVGIYDATDQIVQTGFINYLMWTAMLSINLGIINLVPLPALDGGRLLFVGIEAVRGKPIDPQKEGFVHVIGFLLLMLLMLVVTWNDIQRLFL